MTNPMIHTALITDHQRAMQRAGDEAQRAQAARRAAPPQPAPAKAAPCTQSASNAKPKLGLQS